MFRLEGWKNPFARTVALPRDDLGNIFEAGADAMHLADVKYLEEHKVLVNYAKEGKVSITFRFSVSDWLAFTGKEVV